MLPSGSPGEALAAVCARLKICFVDRLDPDARGAMLDDLLGAHRRELAQARAALERCEHPSPFVRRCLIRDVEAGTRSSAGSRRCACSPPTARPPDSILPTKGKRR
jgi:hypothetical protein